MQTKALHFRDKRFTNQLLSPASQTNNILCEYRELVFPSNPCVIVNIELHLKDKTFTNQLLPWWFRSCNNVIVSHPPNPRVGGYRVLDSRM